MWEKSVGIYLSKSFPANRRVIFFLPDMADNYHNYVVFSLSRPI